jgi:putative serine protease PepD
MTDSNYPGDRLPEDGTHAAGQDPDGSAHPYGSAQPYRPVPPTESYPDAPLGTGTEPYAGGAAYAPVSYPQGTVGAAGEQSQFGAYAPPPAYGPGGPPPPMTAAKNKRRPFSPLVLVAVLAALVGGGVGAGTVAIADHNDGGTVNTGLRITNQTGAPTAKLDGSIGAAAAKIRPSVVTINVSSGTEAGTGSGVILRADGHVLTNDHVVSVAASGGKLSVTLSDGRTAGATIVGRDSPDDLAVIKVDGLTNLTPATFAKSADLTVGQSVVAVGAPLGLSDTVTSGIVSNTARPVRSGDNNQAVFEAVQTDAAINPGNSGGPLVDLNGSVVGINAAIASDQSNGGLQIPGQPAQQAGNIGIGFAIPSDEASRIASELIANGKAYHAVIGISVGNDTSAATPTSAGVTVQSVTPGGPAATAGLKAGDVVSTVNAQLVTTSDSLIAAVRSFPPGLQIDIGYSRGGKSAVAKVTLGKSDS